MQFLQATSIESSRNCWLSRIDICPWQIGFLFSSILFCTLINNHSSLSKNGLYILRPRKSVTMLNLTLTLTLQIMFWAVDFRTSKCIDIVLE